MWEVGYFAEGNAREAGNFYRQELDENGWTLEGSDFNAGGLDLRANRDGVVVLIEIGQQEGMVEIELEVYEPRSS